MSLPVLIVVDVLILLSLIALLKYGDALLDS